MACAKTLAELFTMMEGRILSCAGVHADGVAAIAISAPPSEVAVEEPIHSVHISPTIAYVTVTGGPAVPPMVMASVDDPVA